MRFKDKVCLVTGGGSGIGRAACLQFAAEGGKVLVVDLNEAHGNDTVATIEGAKGMAAFAKADVGKGNDVRAAVKAAVDRWGRIDVVVNDAPGAVDTPMLWDNPNVKNGTEKVTGSIGEPDDIARAICFLASSDARFVTGTTLVVDGGRLDIL